MDRPLTYRIDYDVLTIAGTVSELAVDELARHIADFISARFGRQVVIDIRAVDFLPVLAMRAVIRGIRYARAHGGDVKLWVQSGGTVDRVLTLAGVSHMPSTVSGPA